MVLYSTDITLLGAMKRSQGSLTGYVLVTDTDVRYCPGCYMVDVTRALDSPQSVHVLKWSPAEVQASLGRMQSLGLLLRPSSAPVFQVTYDGWNARQVRFREIGKAIVTHVVFPSLVALVTTLLTLTLKSCSNRSPEINSGYSATDPADSDDTCLSDLPAH